MGEIRTRITPNTDTFHAVRLALIFSEKLRKLMVCRKLKWVFGMFITANICENGNSKDKLGNLELNLLKRITGT